MDVVTPAVRSRIMAGIRSKNTKPEVEVRQFLHRAGFRFRLHRSDLPGRPDIVLAKHRTVIQVQGCFWHRHSKCRFCTTPASNRAFWLRKFASNVLRDQAAQSALRRLGWRVLILWECQTRKKWVLERLMRRIEG